MEPTEGRYKSRVKKRKTNRVLNILISVVAVLIVVLTYSLMGTSSEQDKPSTTDNSTEQDQIDNSQQTEDTEQDDETDESVITKDESSVTENEELSDQKVIVPSDESDVIEAYINPAWEPIGTEQSEPHVAIYKKASQDWAEMTATLAYATQLSEEDFFIYRIENDGDVNKAIGTIVTNDKQYKYRIHIEWVENEGWKPTLVEELKVK